MDVPVWKLTAVHVLGLAGAGIAGAFLIDIINTLLITQAIALLR